MLRHIAAAAIHVHMFFLSVRVSLRKKWSQEKSTENPSDILRFPFFIRDSLRAHRRYGPNFSLRAAFFFILFRKKIQKFWAGNMCLSQHGAVSCRFAIHTQLLKEKTHWVIFSSWPYALSFFRGTKYLKKIRHIFSKNRERAQGFSGSTMDRSEHDGNERAWCTELVL